MMSSSSPLRWGLIATGWIAEKFAAAVNETPSGTLAAVGSRSLSAAEAFAARHGVARAYGSYDEVIADPGVEAVYISTPHPMHAQWAIAAARAGKHILCEKPITMNAAEAEAVAAAAREAGVFLMEAFQYRCHPFMARMGEIIASGEIGAVGLIEAVFGVGRPFDSGHRLFSHALGGGGILDLGCYTVSVTRFLAGAAMARPFADPEELVGLARIHEGVDIVATANLKFENDLLAALSCGPCLPQDSRVRVFGELGRLEIASTGWHAPAGDVVLRVTREDGGTRTEEVRHSRSIYALEAETVAAAVRAGRCESAHMPIADTLGNMRTLDRWLAAAGVSY